MARLNLPPGYRFCPTDQELIQCYLRSRVMGSELPCDTIKDRCLYGPYADPWIVFPDDDNSWIQHSSEKSEEKVMYVFVHLTRMAGESKNVQSSEREHYVRKAGCGTWGGKTVRSKVMDRQGNVVIGERRMLKFEVNKIPQGYSKSNFIVNYYKMHEYNLWGYQDFVLCKITLDHSRKAPFKLHVQKNIVAGINEASVSSENISDKCHKRRATQGFSYENNNVGESSSMVVSVSRFNQQRQGRLILHSNGAQADHRLVDNCQRFNGTTSNTFQNFNVVCGNEGELLNNIGQLEYDCRTEEQGSDQGFRGATDDNFQSSDGDQRSIRNTSSVEIDEDSSRVSQYQPFGDDVMHILDNMNEFACFADGFFNNNEQQPAVAEQQPVQDDNEQQLVEDNVQSSRNLQKQKF